LLDVLLSGRLAGRAAFLDDALGVGIGLAENFLTTNLGLGELLFDFSAFACPSSIVRRRCSKIAMIGPKANFLRIA
jgi:hypothetical protein